MARLVLALSFCFLFTKLSHGLSLIYPGTKWCGKGRIATSYDDLGFYKETDTCCRAHDYCERNIPAKTKLYGITNPFSHTVSECKCDDVFEKCLKKVGDRTSLMVWFSYFLLLRPQCAVIACIRRDGGGSCKKYSGFLTNYSG